MPDPALSPQMARTLPWPSCNNARDLGGLPASAGYTRFGAFVRSDSVTRLTPEGIAALKAYGIRTVVDLRYPSEWVETPNPLMDDAAIRVMPISLLGGEDGEVRARDGQILDRVEWMAMVLNLARRPIAAVMRAVTEAPEGGLLFHCAGGKDRTGVVAMLLLSLAGVAREEIAADYALSAEGVREALEAARSKYGANPLALRRIEYTYACPPEVMLRAVDHLVATYGGAEAYLRDVGLGDGEIERIRSRLVRP